MGWLICCQLVTGHGIVSADIPRTIHYQGRLTELSGTPLTGEHTVTIRLYDAPTGGAELWKEQHAISMAREDEGIVSIELGSRTPFPTPVTFNSSLWLTIEIDGAGELSPRQALSASGYAMNADALDGLDSLQLLRADIDTIAKGQLKVTKSGAALVVQPSSDPVADTKLIDVQNAAGASKFSVDLEGDTAVAGNLTVSGTIAGSSSLTGTTNPSWAIASGTDAGAANLSLLFGQASGQESLVFQGAGSDDFALSDDLRLDNQSALRFVEAAANGTEYVALQAPSSIAGNVTWTLPGADGSASQVLTTDGAGALSWTTVSSIGGVGDITDVAAGSGLIGGGASGAVTLTVGAGTGLIANPDDVAIDPAVVPQLDVANTFTATNTMAGTLLMTKSSDNIKIQPADDTNPTFHALRVLNSTGTTLTFGITKSGSVDMAAGATLDGVDVGLHDHTGGTGGVVIPNMGDLTDVLPGIGILVSNPGGPQPTVAIDTALVPRLSAANVFTAANTFNPGAVDLTPLTIRQTSAASAQPVLSVTNNAGGSPYLTVASSGNVGIGTAGPDAPLDIRAVSAIRTLNVAARQRAAYPALLLENTSTNGSWALTENNGLHLFLKNDLASNFTNADLLFKITQNGNVGINAQGSDPSTRLDVFTSDTSTTFLGGLGQIAMTARNTNNTTNNWVTLGFAGDTNTYLAAIGVQQRDAVNKYGDLAFLTRSAAGSTEKVRITSEGKVGIGATNPVERLEVSGNIKVTGAGKIIFQDGTTQKTAAVNRVTDFKSNLVDISDTSDTELLSVTIEKSQATSALLVLATVQLTHVSTNDKIVDVKLFRDLTLLDPGYKARIGTANRTVSDIPVSLHSLDDTSGVGTYTFRLKARSDDTLARAGVRRLTVIELWAGT
ncbi:MAG: hypothetical protein HYS71_00170 [Candidatus Omnitrophica bacterium]|nr:hypothetical protein [Candidatus Omnitrophota bacterium]